MPQFKTIPIFISSALSVLFLLLLSSCTKQNGKAKEKRVKEAESIEIGLKNSDSYINLLKKANKADVPVRVRVYKDNQAEVAEMIPATSQEIEKFRNH